MQHLKVAVRPSYTEDARFLKVNLNPKGREEQQMHKTTRWRV